jgi:hypothetical protein
MRRIDLRRRSVPNVADLRDIVWICTTVERPDANVSTIVQRPGVIKVHARILDLRPEIVLNYQAVMGTQHAPTKAITIRMPPDVKIDLNHWVYQETGFGPIWHKVRSVEDLGGVRRFLEMHCSIETVNDSRRDPATQEAPPKWKTPEDYITDRI